MSNIRTFVMHVVVGEDNEGLINIHELLEPAQVNLSGDDQLVFIDMDGDKLHSVDIHKGPVHSRYGHTARLANRTIAVPIGTPLGDILAIPNLEVTWYWELFTYIHNALQGYPEKDFKPQPTKQWRKILSRLNRQLHGHRILRAARRVTPRARISQ